MVKDLFKLILPMILLIFLSNNSIIIAQKIKNGFSIIVLSDIHVSNDELKDNRLKKIVFDINSGHFDSVELLVTTGDNVSSFQKSRYGDKSIENQRGKRFFEIIKQVNTNYLIALGNHDYKIDSDRDSDDPFSKAEIDTMEILWEKIAGLEPYRSFEYKGWNMIMLNSMRGRYLDRFFDDQQMTWFENELEKDMPSLVFFHHPIETDHAKNLNLPTDIISPEQEKAFYKIIADNKNTIKGIFAGHIHRWHKDTIFEEIPFFVTDSFADNERSPYTLITVDTLSKLIYVEQNELLDN